MVGFVCLAIGQICLCEFRRSVLKVTDPGQPKRIEVEQVSRMLLRRPLSVFRGLRDRFVLGLRYFLNLGRFLDQDFARPSSEQIFEARWSASQSRT